jgi:hypothetical protein
MARAADAVEAADVDRDNVGQPFTGHAVAIIATNARGLKMRRLIPFIALVATLAWAAPTAAIIGGDPDSGSHPYVGMTFDDHLSCSGTLIAPTVFLTAGHCADFLKVPSLGPGWVTFQEDGQAFPEDVAVAQAFTYPGFCADGGFTVPDCPGKGVLGFAQYDVGIVLLATPVEMARYGELPSLDEVDTVGQKAIVTQVGYGIRVRLKKLTDEAFERYQVRAEIVRAAGQDWAGQFYRVTANPGGDKGGSCFGDSGGPDFLGTGTTILGVHSRLNNVNCAGLTWSARVDTKDVRDWIRSFLP